MDYLEVTGQCPLEGKVSIAGAKNSVTKLLVASLLSDKPCLLRNVPNIHEVEITLDLCRHVGAKYHWDKEQKTIQIQTKELENTYIPQKFSGSNRIPILMIGALLGRTDEDIIIPTAGGCKIGKRPIDFHIDALRKLGANIEYREMKKEGAYLASAHLGLKGTPIDLPFPSIGATENTLLAAARAKGETHIRNAPYEPEILDLIHFLQKMGVGIAIEKDRTIVIRETKEFFPVEHTVISDRIEAVSYALAGIGTGGSVYVEGARQEHMSLFLSKLRAVGGWYKIDDTGILFDGSKSNLKGNIHVETDVHPGFLTDWQQPFVTLLTQVDGTSIIHEKIYENRFGYTETLCSMGADIQIFGNCVGAPCRFFGHNHAHSAMVKGKTPLTGKKISIPDLRAGFAYVLAALYGEGVSEIYGLSFLDRGYEDVTGKLLNLGAKVTRVSPAQKTLCSTT